MFRLTPALPNLRATPGHRMFRTPRNLGARIRAGRYVTSSSPRLRPSEPGDTKAASGSTRLGRCTSDPLAVVDDLREGGAATTGRLVTLRTLLVHALKIKSPVLQLDLKLAFRHLSPSTAENVLICAGRCGNDGGDGDGDGSEDTERPAADHHSLMKWTPASRCQAMTTWLEAHQLTQSRCDPCLYLGAHFHVFFLHDSVLVIGAVDQFQTHILAPRFDPVPSLHHVDSVLGIQIRRSDDHRTLYLSQPRPMRKALSEMAGVTDDSDEPATPVTPKLHLAEASDAEHEAFLAMGVNYRQSVGLLTHIASTTRPDVAFASSYLAQFTEKPGAGHWAEVVRCWRYLRGTQEKALALSARESAVDLELWSDANWAGDPSSRKSHSGYLASLHGSAISWSSARQRTHVDVHTKWLRDHVQNKVLAYRWLPTTRMLADCLTKPASRAALTLLCSKLPLV